MHKKPQDPAVALEQAGEAFRDGLLYSSLLLWSLELSDRTIYDPSIGALLGTASHFCYVVVLKLSAPPVMLLQD